MDKCIPFSRIIKGSRLVIYGCGYNGTICYQQLIESGYCELADIVDENYENRIIDGNKVHPVSVLKQGDYDFVLITILEKKIANEIKKSLVGMGLDQNKILCMDDKPKTLGMEHIYNMEFMLQYLIQGFKNRHGYAKKPGEYYSELEVLMISCSDNKDVLFYRLKEIAQNLKDNEIKFILLVLMYQYDYFDRECMEMYMKCMINVEWHDDTFYACIINSTIMVFKYPNYIYDNFFRDRKLLQKKLCEYYAIFDIPNVKQHRREKIAITAMRYKPNCLSDAPSKLIQRYALEFDRLGFDVRIFVLCAEADTDVKNRFLIFDRLPPKFCVEDDQVLKDKNIYVEKQFKSDVRQKMRDTVRNIIAYQPSFIVDMADECFLEAAALIRYFPIISFPMRGNGYSSIADRYIFSDINRVKIDNDRYHVVPMERVREVVLGNLVCSENKTIRYSRKQYHFDKSDFIMVTVGSGLHYQIDGELIENICGLLNKKERIKWLLVGDQIESNNCLFNFFVNQKRIILWGYEENLENLYQICDLYLNPNRIGGGVSIRLAMKQGLPIAMTDFPSDACSRMNPDHIVHGGYDKLMEYIVQLCDDPVLYKKISQETRQMMANFSPKKDAEKVLAVCREAMDIPKKE